MNNQNDIRIANKVSVTTIITNMALTAFKLLAGFFSGSAALISDAVHTASDVFSTIIVIVGVNLAGRKSDKTHQYGHERFECVASIILSVILAIVGFGIGYGAIMSIVSGEYSTLTHGTLALATAVVSIIAKEWMYWYTRKAAKKINSGALMADAWHHRSDSLSSIGAFVGIFGAMLGFAPLDAIAGLVICVFVVKAALDIFKDAVNKMVDKACDSETLERLKGFVAAQSGVLGIDEIRTRMFGSKIYVDIEIAADGELKLTEAHEIAENVHDAIEAAFPLVKHCMVHVNPADTKADL